MVKEAEKILNSYDMKVSDYLIRAIINMNLNLIEFIVLVYFFNDRDKIFDPKALCNQFTIKENDMIEAVTNLISKQLIEIETGKDNYGKIVEKINTDKLNKKIIDTINNEAKSSSVTMIFSTFEQELKRTLSPMEYEIINAWLDNDISEEVIIGALKEAVFNGVNSLRYIDKILYEWGKKGFKSMKDVNAHLKKNDDKKPVDLFEYNWLDDEE